MAPDAAPIQDRRDVLVERHPRGVDTEVGGSEQMGLVLTRSVVCRVLSLNGSRNQERRGANQNGEARRSAEGGSGEKRTDRHGAIPRHKYTTRSEAYTAALIIRP
jgi:hypothetical protein